jgi:hypothetical protein
MSELWRGKALSYCHYGADRSQSTTDAEAGIL